MAQALFGVSVPSKSLQGPSRTISGMTIEGTEELKSVLLALGAAAPMGLAKALNMEAEKILTAAKELTPVDTGNLRASGIVKEPVISGPQVSVELGFGGAAAPYALYVHENLNAHHPVGEAKFLERPFLEAVGNMENRLAEDINKGA